MFSQARALRKLAGKQLQENKRSWPGDILAAEGVVTIP